MDKSVQESNNPIKKILIFYADPKEKSTHTIDKEVSEIEEGLKRSKRREQFEIDKKLAAKLWDLRRSILDHEPQIFHFIGQGTKKGLMLESGTKTTEPVSSESISGLFKLFSKQVKCVILSACYSETQADAISKHIDYVIGMQSEIKRDAAIEFAVGFYDALGAGRTVEDAFRFGCNAIQQRYSHLPKHLIPVLKKRQDLSHESMTGTLITNEKKEIKDKGDNNEKKEKRVKAPTEPVPSNGVTVIKLILKILFLIVAAVIFIRISLGLLNNKMPSNSVGVRSMQLKIERNFYFYLEKGIKEYNNENEEAIDSFKNALEYRPNEPYTLYYLALTHKNLLNDETRAYEYLKKAVENDFRDKERVLKDGFEKFLGTVRINKLFPE